MKLRTDKRYTGNRRGLRADGSIDPDATIMETLKINLLSPVDRPAQDGAVALLMKRDGVTQVPDTGEAQVVFQKDSTPGVITSAEGGHSHIVWLHGQIGETSWGKRTGSDSGHDHPWSLAADGTITIGENDGHSHSVASSDVTAALVAKGDLHKENDMDPKELKALETRLEKAEERAEASEKRAELQVILTGMSDAQRTHFDPLDEVAKAAFATKSSDERDAELATIAKAKTDADPIVYTSENDGTVVRKSDGPLILALVKRADTAEKRAEKAEAANVSDDLRKRARTELDLLPGTEDDHVALLKAVDSIPEGPARDQAMATLKAGNDAIKGAFATTGAGGDGEEFANDGTAGAKLDALVKKHQESESVSFSKAYTAVLKTPEGHALYAESVKTQ